MNPSGLGDAITHQPTITVAIEEPGEMNKCFFVAEITFQDGNTYVLNATDDDVESVDVSDVQEFVKHWLDTAQAHGMVFETTQEVDDWIDKHTKCTWCANPATHKDNEENVFCAEHAQAKQEEIKKELLAEDPCPEGMDEREWIDELVFEQDIHTYPYLIGDGE